MRALRQSNPTGRHEKNLSSRARLGKLSDRKNYFSFTVGLFQSSRLFRLWETYVKFFRRFRFVTTSVRLLPWILLLISTHTLLYAVAAVAVFLIPLFALTVFSLAASAPIRHKTVNTRMAKRLVGKKVYVVFPERRQEFEGATFWLANVFDLAARRDACVIVVSPFLLSPRGLGENRFYFNVRPETSNVFLVRRHYFFSLRRHVLIPLVKQLIFIY